MQKISIIFIFIFILTNYASTEESILDVQFEFETSYLPANNWILNSIDFIQNACFDNTFKIEFILLDKFFIGGSIKTIFHSISITSFLPNEQWYGIWCGLRFDNFEFGIEHYCFHPVFPYIYSCPSEITVNIEGGYTKIYFKIAGKINIF